MLRTALTIGVSASLFLVCLLVLLGILGQRLTTQTLVTSALMAIIPLFVIVPTFLWLDRYEAEPARYQVFAFLWGALVAVVGAFFLNTFGLKLLVEARWTDPLETGAVYLAPVTEETLKGLGILLIYLVRRREFDGIIDGIVYAGLIGAGFAFSENILYLGQAYDEYGSEGLTSTFLVRGLMGPFGHPLFTSLTGIGIGIAVSARRPAVRAVAVLGGWVCAMLLHGLWNLSALAGMDGFFEAYVTYQVPLDCGAVLQSPPPVDSFEFLSVSGHAGVPATPQSGLPSPFPSGPSGCPSPSPSPPPPPVLPGFPGAPSLPSLAPSPSESLGGVTPEPVPSPTVQMFPVGDIVE
jgi:RsiW-degrading membrane proteinase PrsW (M82 family)